MFEYWLCKGIWKGDKASDDFPKEGLVRTSSKEGGWRRWESIWIVDERPDLGNGFWYNTEWLTIVCLHTGGGVW